MPLGPQPVLYLELGVVRGLGKVSHMPELGMLGKTGGSP